MKLSTLLYRCAENVHYTRSKALIQDAGMSKEGDVEPDDVASVAETVRFKAEAATGPESVPTESAGPELVPSGDGPGSLGSAGLLPAEVFLGDPGGLADPTTEPQ